MRQLADHSSGLAKKYRSAGPVSTSPILVANDADLEGRCRAALARCDLQCVTCSAWRRRSFDAVSSGIRWCSSTAVSKSGCEPFPSRIACANSVYIWATLNASPAGVPDAARVNRSGTAMGASVSPFGPGLAEVRRKRGLYREGRGVLRPKLIITRSPRRRSLLATPGDRSRSTLRS